MLINGANLCLDGLVQITWWSAKWINILDDLMHIYIFLSIMLREGGKFTIDTAKCCLFRLIELQPGECLFWFLVESSFFLHMLSTREPSVVFETVFLSYYSISSIFRRRPFSEKPIQASLYLIYITNRLHDANKLLAKDMLTLRLCPDLPIQ